MMLNQITNLYIVPEIKKRCDGGMLPSDFKVQQCLIKLPINGEPVVLFNEEIHWKVWATVPEIVQTGDMMSLHQLTGLHSVILPEENGERVAFIFLKYRSDGRYDIIFDVTSNQETSIEERQTAEKETQALLLDLITQNFSDRVADLCLCNRTQELLYKNGLWVIPRLMPYPLSEVIQCIEKSPEKAIEAIQKYCCQKGLLEEMLEDWKSLDAFRSRQNLLEDCLFAHKHGKYSLSIHSLMPQLEGIITDWIFSQLPEKEVPWRQESKTKKFKDILMNKDPFSLSYSRVIDSVISFIIGGPVLSTFEKWFDAVDDIFPNRHVIEHGKYEGSLYTEINSLRLFLLLDTIFYLIKTRDGEFLDSSQYVLVTDPTDQSVMVIN